MSVSSNVSQSVVIKTLYGNPDTGNNDDDDDDDDETPGIDFKILIITFKAIHGQAPDYICNLINVRNFSTYGLRSNSELLLVPPSTKTKKTLGDRAFTAAAPSLWNKLRSAIRDEDNLTRFKSKLKTFLFRVAYNTM